MAVTKILARKGRLDAGINYVLNGDKTEERILTAHLNCDPGRECRQMLDTKRSVGKEDGVQYYHIIQSFKPGEVTPEQALEIATEFAKEHLPGYETVIGVHVDKEHIHAHMVFNSVNADTGEKYHSNAQSYYRQIRATSDRLCREHGLSVIMEGGSDKAVSYIEWLRQSRGQPTFRSMLEADLRTAIEDANDLGHFFMLMEHKGWEISHGNRLGFRLDNSFAPGLLFCYAHGGFILELAPGAEVPENARLLGTVTAEYTFATRGETVDLEELEKEYEGRLESVFPYHTTVQTQKAPMETFTYQMTGKRAAPKVGVARPAALIPVFPGTNCELDTARAFQQAGAETEILVIKNRTPQDIEESVQAIIKAIDKANIIAFPGGFSGGDEPDGSGKFIATTFKNPAVSERIHELLTHRDGLALGICNGFQALIKLGLVPYGKVCPLTENSPTLTYNNISRHVSTMVNIRVASAISPWLSACRVGEVYSVPVSHGEGKIVAPESELIKMKRGGQIATQYVDLNGVPTMESPFNPNGSMWAIEGITSPDGRVFGKMGHAERKGENLYKNFSGNFDMKIFESGVKYFK